MKKYLLFLSALIFAVGCSRVSNDKEILAKINNYEITKEKFDTEFKESMFGSTDTQEARKEFLNNLINRKLILQGAQTKGLDKERVFLGMIEKFWEQSLLTASLDKKTKEIYGSLSVSDKEIQELYEKMVKEGKIAKPYAHMYEQLKREITRSKESEAINAWIEQLHKNAQIKINAELLEAKK